MTATHKNFLKTMISAVAGSGLGALTIDAASSGYRTFGAGDDGLTFDGVTIKEGTAWEVRDGCVYTHSGTSLSRGTLMDSSTGSAIAFTSAAVVSQGGTAGFAARLEQASLNQVAASPTTADVTGVVGTLHLLDISGLTASRNFILPAVAAVGDRIGVFITTGDDTYGLILKADTGDSIVADGSTYTATEWTRLLSSGEMAIFRCTAENSTWVVESRTLNPLICTMLKTTNTVLTTATATKFAVNSTSLDTAGGQADPTTNNRINIRRGGRYQIKADLTADATAITGGQVRVYKNGAFLFNKASAINAAGAAIPADAFYTLAAGDYLELYGYHTSGANRTYYGAAADLATSITSFEVL